MRTFGIFNPAHGMMKRRRPEISHLQYITMLLEARGMEARTVTEIEALAQDRKIWYKIAISPTSLRVLSTRKKRKVRFGLGFLGIWVSRLIFFSSNVGL
jgi:flagellar biosynthesis regulator FlaF